MSPLALLDDGGRQNSCMNLIKVRSGCVEGRHDTRPRPVKCGGGELAFTGLVKWLHEVGQLGKVANERLVEPLPRVDLFYGHQILHCCGGQGGHDVVRGSNGAFDKPVAIYFRL